MILTILFVIIGIIVAPIIFSLMIIIGLYWYNETFTILEKIDDYIASKKEQ